MQTFIPYATTNYDEIAKVLDNKRLHKQALEGWQIMMVLLELDPDGKHRHPKGWVNHPAVKMWKGHELALYNYVLAMVKEWKSRGFKSTLDDKAGETISIAIVKGRTKSDADPTWITDDAVASSHRLALLQKDYDWYHQFGWAEDTGVRPDHYDYKWPVA